MCLNSCDIQVAGISKHNDQLVSKIIIQRKTALHYAAWFDHHLLVEYLVEEVIITKLNFERKLSFL